jgi:hypothetical protein
MITSNNALALQATKRKNSKTGAARLPFCIEKGLVFNVLRCEELVFDAARALRADRSVPRDYCG